MSKILDDKLTELSQQGVSELLCQHLGDLIRTGQPAQLARMSPPRFALQWKLPESEVLEAFLLGTRIGLFELEWDLRCPSCTGPTSHARHLDALGSADRCEMCEVDYEASFDSAVEITWCVHPALRDLGELNPRDVFVAYAQPQPVHSLKVEPGVTLHDEIELKPGTYHVFKSDFSAVRGLRIDKDLDEPLTQMDLTVDASGIDRGSWHRQAGRYKLSVQNRTEVPLELVVSRVTDLPWVSGARLAAHQSFRDIFSEELIGPNQSFAIRHSAFVFTDIKGSTELYERIGDSRAYALVRDHFAIMTEKVRQHGGAIVKTIGDAIMATFTDSATALRFAWETIEAFDAFNSGEKNRDDIIIKVGVHSGPCIAVTLNDRLDYFGRTVNLSARIQGLSVGRDIVISQDVARSTEVQALLAEMNWSQEPFGAHLKGIAGDYPVLRLRPD